VPLAKKVFSERKKTYDLLKVFDLVLHYMTCLGLSVSSSLGSRTFKAPQRACIGADMYMGVGNGGQRGRGPSGCSYMILIK